MQKITRRTFVETAMTGSMLSLSFALPTGMALLTPGQARAGNVPLRRLTAEQAQSLDELGEAILPGAAAAGLTHFIDHQLAADPNDALLVAKYFQVKLPYADFYAAGVQAAEGLARAQSGSGIHQLSAPQMQSLLTAMCNPETAVPGGFPLFLFYMCLRSDAVDVVYGTPAGFKKLNIPYMQHIMPPGGWNG